MDVLTVALLKELDGMHELLAIYDIEIFRGKKGQYDWIDITHPKVESIADLATDVVFTKRGHLNQLALRELRNNGYTVFPVEVDKDYGWITAGIKIADLGVIVVYNDNLNNRWRKGNN